MKLYLPFSKAEKQDDGTIIVTGIASSETKDAQGEIVKADAMKAAIPEYMAIGGTGALREMHQQIAAGVVLKAEVNEKGETHIEAKVVDANSVRKVEEGVFKGFSIGGKSIRKSGKTIEELMLKEISLVDRPANPDARFDLYKADGIADAPEPEAIEKSLYTTSRIADLLSSVKSLETSDAYENNGVESPVSPSIKAACKALSAALVASATLEAGKATAKADDDLDLAKLETEIGTAVLAKAEALLEPIAKGLTDLTEALAKAQTAYQEDLAKLADRIAVVEKAPAAPKAALTTVSKAEETGGKPEMTAAEIAKALADLPEAERTSLLFKAALANPIRAA